MDRSFRHGISRRIAVVKAAFHGLIDLPWRLRRRHNSRHVQNSVIKQNGYDTCDKLVIFFIPSNQWITGGTLQIFTLHRLTRDFFKETETKAVLCWLPGGGWDIHHLKRFGNDETIFPLSMILSACRPNCKLMFHLPEYAVFNVLEGIGWRRLAVLREEHDLKVNVLNQNIEVMQTRKNLDRLKEVLPDLTSTVGNPTWASEKERQRLDIPIHVLPTWYYPDDAPWQPYESKRNLMLVSKDPNPNRDTILAVIRNELPELEIQIVEGVTYRQYMAIEKSAKWSLTFGEGLDGYFYGSALRGGVPFAVRNRTFDMPGYDDLITVYDSYKIMAKRIVSDIKFLDSKNVYEEYNTKVREPFLRLYGREKTTQALKLFYLGKLTFP